MQIEQNSHSQAVSPLAHKEVEKSGGFFKLHSEYKPTGDQFQKPTLIIAHNKTLAGQLYSEFKEFFPENAVEYFVSY